MSIPGFFAGGLRVSRRWLIGRVKKLNFLLGEAAFEIFNRFFFDRFFGYFNLANSIFDLGDSIFEFRGQKNC